MAQKHTKCFAPLDPARSHESHAPLLKGIVFDVDGTLWYVAISVIISGPEISENLSFIVQNTWDGRISYIQTFLELLWLHQIVEIPCFVRICHKQFQNFTSSRRRD